MPAIDSNARPGSQNLWRRWASHPSLPLALLAVISVLSLAARGALLSEPCRSPCRSAADHVLIFDESYYVNAARVIAGLRPLAGQTYARAPLGTDPNAEHPQLAKLIMAGSIELFGDGPLAWRLGSLIFGSLAILGMFVLVRAAGGGRWIALGAAALMASDNLILVHGRIGTLDIYALAAMVWGVALYLRGRCALAGIVIGVGSCFKLVTPYALLILAVLEATTLLAARGHPGSPALTARARRLAACTVGAAASFIALLTLLDRVAPPYDDSTGKRVTGGPFAHLGHMLHFAAKQTSPHGPYGIASYPWQWLGDYKPITYLNINPARPSPGLDRIHPAVHFLGMISPPTLALALPALGLGAVGILRRRGRAPDQVALLGVAWFIATWVPFELLSLLLQRTSYLYYMVVVMPGVYLAVAALIARLGPDRRIVWLWMLGVLAAAVVMYPFTPLP